MRLCQPHLEELHFHLASIPVMCPACGLYATEGLLTHDCKNPTAQPDKREILVIERRP